MDGVTTVWWTGSDQARRHEAIIAMAGAAAETRAKNYSREQCDELWKTVWAVDKENCKRQLGGAGTEHAMRQARWIVEDNWDGVEKSQPCAEMAYSLSPKTKIAVISPTRMRPNETV